MNHSFQAVFERGVLRPLEPLNLREQEVVSVSIVETAAPESLEATERMSAEQKQAILALLDEMERMR